MKATEQPLLVVVEAPPEMEVDASEIRRAIATELRRTTLAPTELSSCDSNEAMIVAVDNRFISLSLRHGEAPPVGRAIAAPADPASRVRAITWLAGNLARDQVTEMVEAPPPPAPPAVAAVEPPSFEPPAATIAVSVAPKTSRPSGWSVVLAAGPNFSSYEIGRVLHQSISGSANFTNVAPDIYRSSGTVWRIEARHQVADATFFWGLALEGCTNQFLDELVGAMATAGTARRRGNWSFEARLGAGLDVGERQAEQPTTDYQANGTTVISYTPELRVGLFAAGSVAVARTLSRSLDLVLALDVHQSVVDEYDGYIGSTLGLRYRL